MNRSLNVCVIGGGPAGLYFSILLKRLNSNHRVSVLERNVRGSTFGWGVVLSDETMRHLFAADQPTSQRISDTLAHWDDIDVHYRGRVITSTGHGFCGISRLKLLEILEARAEELGVSLSYNQEVVDYESLLSRYDLVVAADGVFSQTREYFKAHLNPSLEKGNCRFVWLGTKKVFPAFTFIFENTEFGWFQAHCYRFDDELSTFIVECHESTWQKSGIEHMDKDEGIEFCERLFAKYLGAEKLQSNSAHLRGSKAWINFQKVNNLNWHHQNLVLLGDAAGTAHFSIGSGTKLGMEAAASLAKHVHENEDLDAAFKIYQEERKLELLKLQNAARNSAEWFENVHLKAKLEPEQFTYSLLTRSQRVSHENLRLRDKNYLENFEKWFFAKATGQKSENARAPMFVPYCVRDMELTNRVAISPMAMYSAKDGTPGDFHLVHLGARALGGAGLLFTEMTNVSADARISPGCAGIYNQEHLAAWKRIVKFVHDNSPAKIGIQLGHAGRKGSTKIAWEGFDQQLESGNWKIYAPSAIPYTAKSQIPIEMTKSDMARVLTDFVNASKLSKECGFDLIELHMAHGYLLSSFISPLTNRRNDEYGGSLTKRLRFPLEVLQAVRAEWGVQKPISVRISATDWVEGGTTIEDAVEIAQFLKEAGADLIDVSAGQVSRDQKPVYGRMFQTPFSDRIRSEVGISTMAVGNIYEADHVNSIIASGRADLCLLARPHLSDPHWTLKAAADLGYKEQFWPKQYLSGKSQLENILMRAKNN